MTLMYDSTTPAEIPGNAEIVAGYVDGAYVWSTADWSRFPNARKIRIAVFPWTNDGEVLDCEPGDATPDECAAWIRMRQAAGIAVPTIYCGWFNLDNVRGACDGLTYDIWLADPTNEQHLPDGFGACQYDWGTRGHFDISAVADWWPRMEADMEPIPQDYKDKFGADVTWQGVADNLEGIIHALQSQLDNASGADAKLAQIKEIVNG